MLHSLSLKRLPLSLRGKGGLSDLLSTLPIPKQEGQNKLEVLGVELQMKHTDEQCSPSGQIEKA